jgi:hypothetical protein
MNHRYRSFVCSFVTLLSALAGVNAHAAFESRASAAARLKAALTSAQTVFFIEQDVNMVGSAAADPSVYTPYPILYAGLQGMNRYQFLPSAAGADLIFADTRASLNILDGKTLQLVGTLYINPFDMTAKKYTADLVKQLVKLAGPRRTASPIVSQPLPSPTPAQTKRDSLPPSALSAALQTAHSIYILDRGTFPAPKKEQYQPGQMAARLQSGLKAWGQYQIVPTLAGADLVVTFATDDGCVLTGTTTTERIGTIKTDVPDTWCKNTPSVGLRFLDAKTLQILGYLSIDQPDMTIRPGQPDPRDVTFQKLIEAWKSRLTAQTP